MNSGKSWSKFILFKEVYFYQIRHRSRSQIHARTRVIKNKKQNKQTNKQKKKQKKKEEV